MLCEKHWARAKLGYPIFIARGLMEKALAFFRVFSSWSSENVRSADNPFEFPHVRLYDAPSMADSDSPMVLFAGPAMMQGGSSLNIFKKWAPEERNLVVFPGYCLPGTVGNDVLGGAKRIRIGDSSIHVRCRVEYMSHSDHTDARGIMQLISQSAPRHVVLVHGSLEHMAVFKPIVQQKLRIPCSDPAVGSTVDLGSLPVQEALVSPRVLSEAKPSLRPPLPGEPLDFLEGKPQAATFTALFSRKRKRCQEDHDLELFPCSAAGADAAGLRRHALMQRHDDPMLDEGVFRRAWGVLESQLDKEGVPFSWKPPLPKGAGFEPGRATYCLSFLSLRCGISCSKRGLLGMSVEWDHDDVQRYVMVARFLEALNAW